MLDYLLLYHYSPPSPSLYFLLLSDAKMITTKLRISSIAKESTSPHP